jgi:choline dehydrogenase
MRKISEWREWRSNWCWRDQQQQTYVVVGGGTGGCITAYILAQLMDTHRIPGRVLLLDSGAAEAESPKPRMWDWFANWARYSVTHETFGHNYLPAPASSHHGLGGASTHDTRITFCPRSEQLARLSTSMGWSPRQMQFYLNSALQLMPPLRSAGCGERFYDAVLQALDASRQLQCVNDYRGQIVPNSVGYVSIAMHADETRWATSSLLEKSRRPSRLEVKLDFVADKVIFEGNKAVGVQSSTGEIVRADEVIITAGSLGTPAILQRSGIGPRATLEALGIPVLVDNSEVGHGVDHTEVAVSYTYLEKWNEADGKPPRGGPMAWPVAMFLDGCNVMAHFGISPPPYGGNEVMATPNCTRPCAADGFRALINSRDPLKPIAIEHADPKADMAVLVRGVRRTVSMFELLRSQGVVGERIEPSDAALADDVALEDWIRAHTGTAYHWMSTCKAGIGHAGTVADEHFRVRGTEALRVGSGAVLPELTEANPHLTIVAFSIALAHAVLNYPNTTLSCCLFLD